MATNEITIPLIQYRRNKLGCQNMNSTTRSIAAAKARLCVMNMRPVKLFRQGENA